ncbi:MAG TPA: DUF397 domain-containing protein [Actinophytocola sp.]|jgi:hypothetical protein|uniref:DUF397 domain-containing protein n=1 Tax=Actinophytocola sp. TaxID=1872138 RepID=UPI002DFBC5B6|nr:DUF397 domain-containing protein [Actinophytocola sp.]
MIDNTAVAPREGWFTSSFSNGSQTCVEIKFTDATVLIRDTKDRGPTISVTSAGWSAFVSTLTT